MANPNFTSILDQRADEIDRPRPLPPGDYICIVKARDFDVSSQKGTKFTDFTVYPLEAMPTVDEDELDRALQRANGESKKLSDIPIHIRFFDIQEQGWRIKKFLLDDCQIDNRDNKTIGELIEDAVGCEVIVKLKHRVTDEGSVFIDVRGTSPVKAKKKSK